MAEFPKFEELVDEDQAPPALPSFDSLQDATAPEVSKTESAIRGGAQGLSFGFADELTGALESMITDKPYEKARDESRAAYAAAEEANPKTFMGSEIAGAVIPAVAATVASGGAAAPATGASVAKALAPSTIKGVAALGATQALGKSEADLTKGDVGEAMKDVTRGAAVGAVAGGAGKALQMGAEALLPALKNLYQKTGTRALGLSTSPIKKMGVEKAEDVVEFALKPSAAAGGKSIISEGANTTKMLETANQIKEAAGSDIGGILKTMDEANVPVITKKQIYRKLQELRKTVEDKAPELGKRVVDDYQKAIADFENLYPDMTFGVLNDFKKTVGDIVYKHGSPLESKAALEDVYHVLKEGLDDAVSYGEDFVKTPGLAKAYEAGKSAYERSLRAIESLEGKLAKEKGAPFIGTGDIVVGGIGAKFGGPLGAAGAVAGKRMIEKQAPQATAKIAHTLSQKLERTLTENPQILGKYVPILQNAASRGQLAAANYVLQQRDPEYAEMLKKIQEEQPDEE